jgi:hypothetical protein
LNFGETILTISIAAVFGWAFYSILREKCDKIRNWFAAGLSLLTVVAFCFAHFGLGYCEDVSRTEFVQTVNTDKFTLPYRIKDRDGEFTADKNNPNYGLLLKYPSLSVWMGAHPANPTYAMRYLGFNEQAVWLDDSGGTIFGDMLMGNRYVISADGNLNSTVYTLLDRYEYKGEYKKKNIYIYEYNYKLPFVQIIDAGIDIEKMYETDTVYGDIDLIATQNELYNKFFGTTDDIIHKLESGVSVETVEGYENMRKITVPAASLNGFYMNLNVPPDSGVDTHAYYLTETEFAELDRGEYADLFGSDQVNKNTAAALYYNYMHYMRDARDIGKGLFDLGFYDSDFTFYVSVWDESYFDGMYIAELDLAKLSAISNNADNYTDFEYTNTGLTFTVNGTAGQKVFIPVTNLTGATAKINGKDAEINLALNAYIAIDLVDGENNIEITFTPMNLKMGAVVTIIMLVLLLILFVLNRFFRLTDKKWVQWVGVGIGVMIFAAIAYLVFIKPFALTIVTDILGIGG